MKKLILFSVFVSLFLGVSLTGVSYSIKVRIKGLKDSTCYLGHYYGLKQYTPVDTSKVDDQGNFSFSKRKDLKEGVYLVTIGGAPYLELIIGSEQNITVDTDLSDIISNFKSTGSKENELFYGFQKLMIEKNKEAEMYVSKQKSSSNKDTINFYKEKLVQLQASVKDYKANLFKKNPTTLTSKLLKAAEDPEVPEFKDAKGKTDSLKAYLYYKDHYFDNFDLSDERMLRTPILIPRIDKFMKDMTVQVPDSIIKSADFLIKKAEGNNEIFKYCVSTITNTYETSNMMGMDAVFVHMAKNYYLKGKCFWADTSVLRKINERVTIVEPLLLGKTCPDTYCADSLGNYVPLHSIQANYIIAVFWDSDCGHCQKEVPKLFTIYKEKLRSRGVAVYAATIERDNKSWTKFLREKKLFTEGWFNVRDQFNHTDFHKTFDVYSTPVIYILDGKKKIIAKRIGVDQIEEFLNNYEKIKKK